MAKSEAALDVAIEVGRERDSLRDELTELRNRHGLLREALAAVRVGEAGPRDASAALFNDAPEGELYEPEPGKPYEEDAEWLRALALSVEENPSHPPAIEQVARLRAIADRLTS